jgi:PAS domain S-box-containing protein
MPTQQNTHYLSHVLDSLFAFVGIIKTDGCVIKANRSALQAAALREEDVIGQPLTRTYWWSHSKLEQKRMEKAIQQASGGEPVRYEAMLQISNGQLIPVDLMLAPVFTNDDSVQNIVLSAVDISATRKVQEQLRVTNERFSVALKSAPVSVFSMDENLRYTWMYNSRLGHKPEEIIGKTDEEIILDAEARNRTIFLKQWVLERDQGLQEEMKVQHNGEPHYFQLILEPLHDQYGEITGLIGASVDITERKEREELLLKQSNELKLRNQELDAFAYTVAHDLKNAISSTIGFASLIESYYDRMPKEEVLEYTRLITDGGQKMKSIINNLMMLSGVSRAETPPMTILNMHRIVEDAINQLTSMPQYEDATINLPDEWPNTTGHGPWVEDVWTNLISNALKYGGKPPMIDIKAEVANDQEVCFQITDNGVGIPPAQQHRLFKPFTRIDEKYAEGHGLGLSIVQSIVGKLGGKVWIESETEQGSTFSFTLPKA